MQATASGRGSVPFAPRWAYSGRMVDTRLDGVRGQCARETLAFGARVRRDVSGALLSRGDLIRNLRRPCGLLVSYTSQTRVSARAAPTSPSIVPKSYVPAGEVDALERRAAAAQRRPTQLRSRAPRTGSPWHRGVAFCPSRHRRDFVSTEEVGPGQEPHKQREHDYYLTPGDPIFVEVALPRASFSFDVDFWWSFVWSFTPCKMVTMFVSRTIPAITISSRM